MSISASTRSDPLLAGVLARDPAVLSDQAGVYLPPPLDERAQRAAHDHDHAAAALSEDGRRFGPWQPVFHTRGAHFAYAECVESTGGERGVAVLATHADDVVTELAVFRHEPVPWGDAPLADRVPADGARVVERYLANLEAGNAEQAAACFAAGAVYSVPAPPTMPERQRLTLQGRDAIEALFAARVLSTAHHVLAEFAAVPDSPHAFVSGTVVDLPGGLTCSFMSSMSFAPDATMARYVVRLCVPGLPWLS